MGLSPEERRRVYQEEKARIKVEEKTAKGKRKDKGSSTTSLKPNVAGLLCYLGFWVSGVIFLSIEKKNKLVRFHAMQSLVTFGILNIIWGIASNFRLGLGVRRISQPRVYRGHGGFRCLLCPLVGILGNGDV